MTLSIRTEELAVKLTRSARSPTVQFAQVIGLFLLACLGLKAQSSFFAEDIIYDGKYVSFEAATLGSKYVFIVASGSERDTFEQHNLDNPAIFKTNLRASLKTLFAEDIPNPSDPLAVPELKYLSDSASSSNLNLTEFQKERIRLYADSLSKVDSCSRLLDMDSLQQILERSGNQDVKAFLQTLFRRCLEGERVQINTKAESGQAVDDLATQLYSSVKLAERVVPEDASLAGRLFLADSVPLFNYNHTLKNGEEKNVETNIGYVLVDSVQVEFENGTLMNVKVVGRMTKTDRSVQGKQVLFQNAVPYPYSTKMSTNFLRGGKSQGEVDCSGIYRLRIAERYQQEFVCLYQLISNQYNLLNRTENYFPKDDTIWLKPIPSGTPIYKEKTSQILETRVYSDAAGFSSQNPNGLIQLEFSKRLTIWDKVFSKAMGKNLYTSYYQWLNYVEPRFAITKIETDDKVLNISKLSVADSLTSGAARFMDVLQYSKSSLGLSLNIFYLGIPNWQSIFRVDYQHNFYVTDFLDRRQRIEPQNDSTTIITRADSTISRLSYDTGPIFYADVNASDKIQLHISYSIRWLKFLDSKSDGIIAVKDDSARALAELASNVRMNDRPDNSTFYHRIELLGKAELGDRGKLFFRGRYHFLPKQPEQHFFQIQLGYSFFFFSRQR